MNTNLHYGQKRVANIPLGATLPNFGFNSQDYPEVVYNTQALLVTGRILYGDTDSLYNFDEVPHLEGELKNPL